MSTATRLLTAEEFFALPGSRHQELVRGEVVELMPPGGVHGVVAALIAAALIHWARQSGGLVGVESGFRVEQEPDTVRGPDGYYVRPERVPEGRAPEAFWTIAPDLAVEVVSPGDTADEVEAKIFPRPHLRLRGRPRQPRAATGLQRAYQGPLCVAPMCLRGRPRPQAFRARSREAAWPAAYRR